MKALIIRAGSMEALEKELNAFMAGKDVRAVDYHVWIEPMGTGFVTFYSALVTYEERANIRAGRKR